MGEEGGEELGELFSEEGVAKEEGVLVETFFGCTIQILYQEWRCIEAWSSVRKVDRTVLLRKLVKF